MPRLLALLGLFALTGCWTGGPFYAASDARPAVPAGDYVMGRTALPGEPVQEGAGQVAILPDGMTRLIDTSGIAETGARDIMTLGFTPLGNEGRHIAFITRFDSQDLSGANAAYGVLVPGEAGSFRLYMPGCGEGLAPVAAAAGAAVERSEDGLVRCRFATRASLETALARFIAAPPDDVLIITLRPRG